ncbi:copper resistance protein CopC [Bacillus sp. PS06]|uniref:copper resistance CopC family protein n=1 Tax=Bacillus sp. PS06 TaxID=2764176 RepID=UPI001786D47B|nr:copper resistance protein CopC [Bacillus sp. PS06]MBD8070661.1 copper resistance protein CopC [Bacillus sp. PS06]
MKKLMTLTTALILALVISNSVFAHSHLQGSNPADGDVLTEPLTEIVLEFDGNIEQGSFIELTNGAGESVELQDTVIGDGTLTGIASEPLANEEYQVNWSIISADGHPLEGTFSFTVDAPVTEQAEEEEVTEEPAETPETVEEPVDEPEQPTETQEETTADEVQEDSSSMPVILFVLLLIIIIAVIFFIMKKRK